MASHNSGKLNAADLAQNVEKRTKSYSDARSSQPQPMVSQAVMLAAAEAGVPIPYDDDDEYGVVDSYIDDFLGTPAAERPSEWKPLTIEQIASKLNGPLPEIILADGTKGVASSIDKQPQEMGPVTPFFHNIINEWSGVDASAASAAEPTEPAEPAAITRTRNGPAPKRSARGQ